MRRRAVEARPRGHGVERERGGSVERVGEDVRAVVQDLVQPLLLRGVCDGDSRAIREEEQRLTIRWWWLWGASAGVVHECLQAASDCACGIHFFLVWGVPRGVVRD